MRFLLVALSLTTIGQAPVGASVHEAYIWQRRWTPAVAQSLGSAASVLDGWRVLIATSEKPGALRSALVDWPALLRTGKPVIATIRLEGTVPLGDPQAVATRIADLVASVPLKSALAGVEIDFDCPTAQLRTYAVFLEALRAHVGPGLVLSITGLPTWLGAPALPAVLAPLDEVTWQLHAVSHPGRGLFDPADALRWAERAASYGKPFRVSLPAYGMRVSWTDAGKPVVESERRLLASGSEPRELVADPATMAGFLKDLESKTLPGLRGVVWFRLPVQGDRRAWSMQTLSAVIAGRVAPQMSIQRRPRGAVEDVLLVNEGEVDAPVPPEIPIAAGCPFGDGLNGYERQDRDGRTVLRAMEGGLLKPGTQRVVGWLRCGEAEKTP